jgi:hypothetical protein
VPRHARQHVRESERRVRAPRRGNKGKAGPRPALLLLVLAVGPVLALAAECSRYLP